MSIIKTLQDSYRIAVKDLLEFERNRIGLIFLFLMPFFMLIMTGFIFPTGSGPTPTYPLQSSIWITARPACSSSPRFRR